MSVKTAQRAEKDLPAHAKRSSQTDELGDLFQLVAKAGSRIQRKWRYHGILRLSQSVRGVQPAEGHSACAPHEGEVLVKLQNVSHRLIAKVRIGRIWKTVEAQGRVGRGGCRSEGEWCFRLSCDKYWCSGHRKYYRQSAGI